MKDNSEKQTADEENFLSTTVKKNNNGHQHALSSFN